MDDRQVYFIRDELTGNIKIGVAADPEKRLQELATGSAGALTILRTEPGGARRELALHKKFSADRVRGEWFRPSDALMEHITSDVVDEMIESKDITQPADLRKYGCSLVGHYFHSFRSCRINGKPSKRVAYQGQVISEVAPQVFLCQLFDWIVGYESNRILMTIGSLIECEFYESSEEMVRRYEGHWSRIAEAADAERASEERV